VAKRQQECARDRGGRCAAAHVRPDPHPDHRSHHRNRIPRWVAGRLPVDVEFLEPLFVTGAGSDDVDYSHPAFDAAVTAAEAVPALPESCALTNAALRVLLRDMPV
jgi:hypothetical protein